MVRFLMEEDIYVHLKGGALLAFYIYSQYFILDEIFLLCIWIKHHFI